MTKLGQGVEVRAHYPIPHVTSYIYTRTMQKSGPDFLFEDIHRRLTLNYATGENLLVSKPFEDLRGCNIAQKRRRRNF